MNAPSFADREWGTPRPYFVHSRADSPHSHKPFPSTLPAQAPTHAPSSIYTTFAGRRTASGALQQSGEWASWNSWAGSRCSSRPIEQSSQVSGPRRWEWSQAAWPGGWQEAAAGLGRREGCAPQCFHWSPGRAAAVGPGVGCSSVLRPLGGDAVPGLPPPCVPSPRPGGGASGRRGVTLYPPSVAVWKVRGLGCAASRLRGSACGGVRAKDRRGMGHASVAARQGWVGRASAGGSPAPTP